MKAIRFSPIVEKILLREGWHPGRHVAIKNVEDWFKSGNILHPAAEAVLHEFDGLYIRRSHEDPDGVEIATACLYFNLFAGKSGIKKIKESHKILNINLVPVADMESLGCFLCVDELGRVFELFDDLIYYAPNFDEALERAVTGRFHAPLPPELQPGSWPMISEVPGHPSWIGSGRQPPRSVL